MMKNYFLLAASALTIFSASAAWDGTAQEWINGDGTASNPYLIETEQHLAYFQEQVTGGRSFARFNRGLLIQRLQTRIIRLKV